MNQLTHKMTIKNSIPKVAKLFLRRSLYPFVAFVMLAFLPLAHHQELAFGEKVHRDVYSELKDSAQVEVFTNVSLRLRCLCGCGLVLGKCPHVDCGFGIPARRFIEELIRLDFTEQEIVDIFVTGALLSESHHLNKSFKKEKMFSAYFDGSLQKKNENEATKMRQQWINQIIDAPIVITASSAKSDKKKNKKSKKHLNKSQKLHQYFEANINRLKIELRELDFKEKSGKGVSDKRNEINRKLYQLATYRVGHGTRVIADANPWGTLVFAILAVLGLGLVIFKLLKAKKKEASIINGQMPQPDNGEAASDAEQGESGPDLDQLREKFRKYED